MGISPSNTITPMYRDTISTLVPIKTDGTGIITTTTNSTVIDTDTIHMDPSTLPVLLPITPTVSRYDQQKNQVDAKVGLRVIKKRQIRRTVLQSIHDRIYKCPIDRCTKVCWPYTQDRSVFF